MSSKKLSSRTKDKNLTRQDFKNALYNPEVLARMLEEYPTDVVAELISIREGMFGESLGLKDNGEDWSSSAF